MTQQMTRDELARNFYVGIPLSPEMVKARATEWDNGMVTDDDRADCYACADQKLAEEPAR